MTDLAAEILTLEKQFQEKSAMLASTAQPTALEQFRIEWLGKKGHLTTLFAKLGALSKEERPKFGQKVNDFKVGVEKRMTELKAELVEREIEAKLSAPKLDVSLPVNTKEQGGGLHPVTLMQQRIISIFAHHGFSVFNGPELDFDFYNFTALNIPKDHPSRDMQDTFFIADSDNLVLRTQTSNGQIHAMLQEKPPLRLISPGRVFRVESDATHTPMFHQIECLLVDENISFAHLKGMITAFLGEIFNQNVKTRFRPSYFPFVEPGAEVDMQCTICSGKGCRVCKYTSWLEIGGCGMIHPNVFEAVQYNSEAYSGFAFGFGIDRMAMLAFGLSDLRQMFEGDAAYHRQFPVY